MIGRRQRDQENQIRNVRPRQEVVDANGYAFNVHVSISRNGTPKYVKVTPVWRHEDTYDPMLYVASMARVLKNQAIQVARFF